MIQSRSLSRIRSIWVRKGVYDPKRAEFRNSAEFAESKAVSRLLQFMLYCAVNGKNKEKVISNIMTLDTGVQSIVKDAIQEIRFRKDENTAPSMALFSSSDSASGINQELQKELLRVGKEKEHLAERCFTLDSQLMEAATTKDNLQQRVSQLEQEREEILERERKNEAASEKLTELLDELSHLREELFETSMQKDEAVFRQQALLSRIEEFEERERHYEAQISEMRQFRDEADELRSAATQLTRLEMQNESLQKRADSAQDLRFQINSLEEKNSEYLKKMLDYEVEMAKVKTLTTQMETYKELNSELRTKLAESERKSGRLELELNKSEEKAGIYRRECEELGGKLQSVETAKGGGCDYDNRVSAPVVPFEWNEEFHRLKLENERLKKASTSADAVDTDETDQLRYET